MNDTEFYRELQAKIATLALEGDGSDIFSSGTIDSFLGGPALLSRTAYLQVEPEQLEDLQDAMLEMVAVLRALYWVLQNSHWQVSGDGFYGDHLLFQRLYEETADNLDGLAEKAVGYLGMEEVQPDDLMARASRYVNKWVSEGCPVKRGLLAETTFLYLARGYYDKIKNMGAMTLGLDDEIMSLCNKHESHVYLLQQRLASLGKTAKAKKAKVTPQRIRISNLGDLSGFLRMSNDVLVRKCEKDLWKLTKDADGHHVIEKLYDGDILNY